MLLNDYSMMGLNCKNKMVGVGLNDETGSKNQHGKVRGQG